MIEVIINIGERQIEITRDGNEKEIIKADKISKFPPTNSFVAWVKAEANGNTQTEKSG